AKMHCCGQCSSTGAMQGQMIQTMNWKPLGLVIKTVTRSQYPDEEDARRALLNQLIENALEGPTLRLLRHNPEELPRRELPPGKWSGIFGLYLARCLAMGERPASRSTFYRVVGRWRTCLHFRERSSHSTCLTCDRLRAKMRHASDFTTHATAADQLLGHLRVAWACKQQYWLARATSRMKSELLTLIIDGFDKSKTLLPRWTRGRTPKGTVFEKNIRTNLNLSAVHAHGWGFYVYISDEQISAGSSWSWEIVFAHTGARISLSQTLQPSRSLWAVDTK
ncbi:unnamed protein product, partial [Effrenium voratum]